ncbi:MAG: hypothetical protein CM15mP74_14180 [Halieaceae bacterium]|nr:MAG: hypothetical protein CM15mP74_14180 [Halieaceae bacterium]
MPARFAVWVVVVGALIEQNRRIRSDIEPVRNPGDPELLLSSRGQRDPCHCPQLGDSALQSTTTSKTRAASPTSLP